MYRIFNKILQILSSDLCEGLLHQDTPKITQRQRHRWRYNAQHVWFCHLLPVSTLDRLLGWNWSESNIWKHDASLNVWTACNVMPHNWGTLGELCDKYSYWYKAIFINVFATLCQMTFNTRPEKTYWQSFNNSNTRDQWRHVMWEFSLCLVSFSIFIQLPPSFRGVTQEIKSSFAFRKQLSSRVSRI